MSFNLLPIRRSAYAAICHVTTGASGVGRIGSEDDSSVMGVAGTINSALPFAPPSMINRSAICNVCGRCAIVMRVMLSRLIA
jgi:hypothetical protein